MSALLLLLLNAVEAAPPTGPPEGTYALDIRVATRTKVPVFGWTDGATRSLLLVKLHPEGEGGGRLEREVCAVSVEGESLGVRVEIPKPFLDALDDDDRRFTWNPSQEGGAFSVDMGLQQVGYSGGPVPTSLEDPRITDWDDDGHPAASIHVHVPVWGSAELFVVQSSGLALSGELRDGRIAGDVDVSTLEQHTLGGKPGIFAQDLRIEAVPEDSVFELTPLEVQATCEDVRQHAGL